MAYPDTLILPPIRDLGHRRRSQTGAVVVRPVRAFPDACVPAALPPSPMRSGCTHTPTLVASVSANEASVETAVGIGRGAGLRRFVRIDGRVVWP